MTNETQKQFLEGTEEVNEIGWDEALAQKGAFMKFEFKQRVQIGIKNWRIVEVEKADYNDPNVMKQQPQFEADVVTENGEQVEKKLSILSKRFMAEAREFLEGKDNKEVVVLAVKKVGDPATPSSVNYDIELVE